MRRNSICAVVVVGLLAAGAALAAAPASATDDSSDTLDALQAVTAGAIGAEAVLTNVATVGRSTTAENAVEATINGVDIVVPSDASKPIHLGDVGVTMPSNAGSGEGTARGGVVAYAGNNADSAVVVKGDGSVQVTTVIANGQAATSYGYQLSLPVDVTWTETVDGGLLATNSAGALVLGVAAPWAKDASGEAVPTRYVLDGSRLTQIVEHKDAGFTYPIVADPWLGAAIFQMTAWHPSEPKVVAQLSVWGVNIQNGALQGGGAGGWAAGQAILKGAGWDELKGKVPAVTGRATYRQQYDCHVLGAYTPITGGPTWDLEGWRSSNPNWLNNVANHRCNWR